MPSFRWLPLAGLLPCFAAAAAVEAIVSNLPLAALLISLLVIAVLTLYNLKLNARYQQLDLKQQQLDQFLQRCDDYIAVLDARLMPQYKNVSLTAAGVTDDNKLPIYLEPEGNSLLLSHLQPGDNWLGEAWLELTAGKRLALSVAITRLNNTPAQYLLLARNIDDLKQQQQQLEQDTLRDPQTGLLSPLLLNEYLHSCIQLSGKRQPNFALMLVKFSQLLGERPVNPNITLPQAMPILAKSLAQLAGPECMIARYNSDTLAVVVPHQLCGAHIEITLNRLGHKLLSLSESAGFNPGLALQTLVGISIYPNDGQYASELLVAANAALQLASKTGDSQLAFASRAIQQRAPEYLTLEVELHKALQRDEFELYYQPRYSIGSNRIVGYEALLRWHNPRRGVLLPQHFLTLADETGFIVQLDLLVFQKCCEQQLRWQQTDISRGRMCLNISGLSLKQAQFVSQIAAQLQHCGLTAEQFEFEIEEPLLLEADSVVNTNLQQLAQMGLHLTLDNFGTGVSSLSVLKQFPLHGLKIAASYIKDMEHNEQQRNITANMIRLASYLQLDVIASGIENEMQAYLLHVMGCDILLGHLFSKALPAAEIPLLLAKESKLVRKQVS
ncbi:putative bifunctional diguanylate cyclase/phosphodiesterase [Rheinheimera fenheensis]|uniref:putative bifunctional diguanylate cyclase/phosphodiesterase n=1 Tax=Rheinheimera fenheensis TaxID=3152295 RepID=UPI003261563B